MRHSECLGSPARELFLCFATLASSALFLPQSAHAQSAEDEGDIVALVERLLVEQERMRARIDELEAEIADFRADSGTGTAVDVPVVASGSLLPIEPEGPSASPIALNGDFRLRYEANSLNGPDRHRMVMRARLAARYEAAPWLTLGARLATGDPDDPNSTDITIGGFDDDLDVSLDRAFARARFGKIQIQGGKFDNPLARTEMLWDGDVGIAGAHVSYQPVGTISLDAIYFAIDEDSSGTDSHMVGGQVRWMPVLDGTGLSADVAVAFLDYRLASLANIGVGDIRTNSFSGGQYLSDFDLVSIYAQLRHDVLGQRIPLSVTAEYVRNLGAPSSADEGVSLDVLLGRASETGDWRFNYGYTAVDTDAVLAAFASDNIPLGSNYLQHRLAVDYVLSKGLTLNATLYHYRVRTAAIATPLPLSWEDRLRLNIMYSF